MTTSHTASDEGDGLVCSEDGVVVRVRPREARGEVPAYEYLVGSERDAPAAVRIRQPVPADVAETDLGFPSACERHWTVDGSDLVAALVVEPDDQIKTVWGVRSDSHPEIEAPTIETAPVGAESPGPNEVDGAERADRTNGSLDLDLDEPASSDVGGVESGGDDRPAQSSGGSAGPVPSGGDSLVAQLVQELESGTIDRSERAALADALEIQASDSTNAFVEHVQSKVERRANRLEEEIESIEESVEQLYGVKADASDISSIKRGLTDLDDRKVASSDLRPIRNRVEEIEADVESEVASVRSQVATLAERTENIPTGDELGTLEERLTALESTASDLDDQLASLESRFEDLGHSHGRLAAEAATDEDVESIEDELRSQLNATTSDVAELRETLQEEYVRSTELSADVGRRLRRSVGTLVFLGVGAAGMLATVPLALEGSSTAAITFGGGSVALAAWLLLGRERSLLRTVLTPWKLLG